MRPFVIDLDSLQHRSFSSFSELKQSLCLNIFGAVAYSEFFAQGIQISFDIK
jgi:hypothetical protein